MKNLEIKIHKSIFFWLVYNRHTIEFKKNIVVCFRGDYVDACLILDILIVGSCMIHWVGAWILYMYTYTRMGPIHIGLSHRICCRWFLRDEVFAAEVSKSKRVITIVNYNSNHNNYYKNNIVDVFRLY